MKPSSNSQARSSSLVYEVHDNFAFDDETDNQHPLSHNTLSLPVSSLPTGSINHDNLAGHSSRRLSFEKHLTTLSCSPNRHTVPSFFNSNFDENGYVFDGVKIDIEDIDNTSVSNITTQSLKRCKSQVLNHYYRLLCFIGWRPFYKEHYYRMPWFLRLVNFFYPILIVSLLFFSYYYDYITCQAKLNVAYDTQFVAPATLSPSFTKHHNLTTTATSTSTRTSGDTTTPSALMDFNSIMAWLSQQQRLSTTTKRAGGHQVNESSEDYDLDDEDPLGKGRKHHEDKCGHVVTTYVLPSVMHFIAYLVGFFYFRINENEQLYALMEKVFLAVNQTLKSAAQDRVIRRLKVFIIFGVFWVFLAISMHILSKAAFGFDKVVFEPQWASITLEVVALVIVYSVYLAVVINHTTQCEMIMFYVNEIRTRLEEKSVPLKDAMQQILDIRMSIGNLNSTVAKMTTLVSLIFVEKFIIGVIILIMNRVYEPLAWIYRVSFIVSWFLILAFTLIQIARLNSNCGRFKQIALSSRVYGYQANTRDELDSFLLFVSSAKLRAKLFGISLQPSVIVGSAIMLSFTMIILFQTSVISTPDSII